MSKQPTLARIAAAAAFAAMAATTATAVRAAEGDQWVPDNSYASVSRTDANTGVSRGTALAQPVQYGEATQWKDAQPARLSRSDVKSELRRARQQGLMDDSGDAGPSDRVLARREAANRAQRDAMMSQWADAEAADRVAVAAVPMDPILALLVVDESDPGGTQYSVYVPNDVALWQATAAPSESPSQPTPADDRATTAFAPAPAFETTIEDEAGSARPNGLSNQGGSADQSASDTMSAAPADAAVDMD